MKLKYDQTSFSISKPGIDGLRAYAIAVMDAMREAEPDMAWCWNVCNITFRDVQPMFEYAGLWSDICGNDGPALRVEHPNQISEPKRRKKK